MDRARCAAPRLACLQLGRGTAAPQPSPPPTQSVPMQSELNVIPVALLRGCTRHTTSCCGISAESRRFAGCSVGVTRSGLTQNRGPAAGWESGRSVLFYVPVDVEDPGSLVPRAARAHFCQ